MNTLSSAKKLGLRQRVREEYWCRPTPTHSSISHPSLRLSNDQVFVPSSSFPSPTRVKDTKSNPSIHHPLLPHLSTSMPLRTTGSISIIPIPPAPAPNLGRWTRNSFPIRIPTPSLSSLSLALTLLSTTSTRLGNLWLEFLRPDTNESVLYCIISSQTTSQNRHMCVLPFTGQPSWGEDETCGLGDKVR
jgi:hypothetical protein